jgi:hypothetical protein
MGKTCKNCGVQLSFEIPIVSAIINISTLILVCMSSFAICISWKNYNVTKQNINKSHELATTAIKNADAAKQHYRQLSMPILRVEMRVDLDRPVGIYLINVGLGSAKLNKIIFSIGNRSVEATTKDYMKKVLNMINTKCHCENKYSYYSFYPGSIIAPDEEYFVFRYLNISQYTESERQNIINVLNSLNVYIEYESIYGNKYNTDNN